MESVIITERGKETILSLKDTKRLTVDPKEDHIGEELGEDNMNVDQIKSYTVTYIIYCHKMLFGNFPVPKSYSVLVYCMKDIKRLFDTNLLSYCYYFKHK